MLNSFSNAQIHQYMYYFVNTAVDIIFTNSKMASEVTDVHLNPLKVLMTLEDNMAEDSIIVADGGDFVGSAAYILRYV